MFGLFSKPNDRAKIAKLEAEIDRLNNLPPSAERRAQLEQHHYDLARRDRSVGPAEFDGSGRMTFSRFAGESSTSTRRTTFSDPLEQRVFDLRESLRRLTQANLASGDTAQAGMTEFDRTQRGVDLTRQLREAESDLAESRQESAERAFEALRQPARDSAARCRELQARLQAAVEALLPLEAELLAAMRESSSLAARGENLAQAHPVLTGRRLESPVSGSVTLSDSPGNLIQQAARCAKRPHLRMLVAQ